MRAAFMVATLVVGSLEAEAQTGVNRAKRGDTTIVVTQGNGRCGAPHDAIEVLRVAGDTKETTFGAVYDLYALPDGGVVLVDVKAAEGLIIRQFDANGKFVRNIGRQGPGPGEYMRQNLSIAVHPRGSIYIRDDDKSVSVYGPDGKLASTFPLLFNNGSTTEVVAADDGSVYVRAPFDARSFTPTAAIPPFLHYDLTGKLLDSLSSAARWLSEGAPGTQLWRLLPDGRILLTRTDKVGFLVAASGKSPTIAEGPGGPVPYLRDEREEVQASRDLMRDKCNRGTTGPREIVPETKPPARNSSIIDVDGRIWIRKATTAQKIPPRITASCSGRGGSFKAEVTYEEPPVFAAFQTDGIYLGEVRFPLRARVTFAGNFAWGIVLDSDDVPVLVKYRLY